MTPHNETIERAVLATILDGRHKTAVATARGILKHPDAFYSRDHRIIWLAICEMDDASERVDAVTVSEKLMRWTFEFTMAKLKAASGLPSMLPADTEGEYPDSALNALGGYGAVMDIGSSFAPFAGLEGSCRKLWDLYGKRELIDHLAKCREDAQGDADLGTCLDRVAGGVLELSRQGVKSEVVDLSAATDEALAEMAERAAGKEDRIMTGFSGLDSKLSGFRRGGLYVLAARPGAGKAQPVSEPVLTPGGWRAMGDLRIGDLVVGANGKPTLVTGVFPQGVLDIYSVRTTDGCETRCCADHLWYTQTRLEFRRGDPGSVKKTGDIIQSIFVPSEPGRLNHRLPICSPIEHVNKTELPLQPYLLGALIGDGGLSDGSVMLSNCEEDVLAKCAALLPDDDEMVHADRVTWRIRRNSRRSTGSSVTMSILRDLGLWGRLSHEKKIPEIYLRASVGDRLELLRGLCDTDGHICGKSTLEYSSSSPLMAGGFMDLVRGLGGICSVTSRIPHYTYRGERREGRRNWRFHVHFPNGIVPVSSAKHLARGWSECRKVRNIESIEPAGAEECVCISVDAQDSLYVTKDHLVTHNTTNALVITAKLCQAGRRVLFISLEVDRPDLSRKLMSHVSAMDFRAIDSGLLDDAQQLALQEAVTEMRSWKMSLFDGSDLTTVGLRSMIKRQATPPELVIVDYLQLLAGSRSDMSEYEKVSEISRVLKVIAREIRVPVLALAQMSRDSEKGTPREPRLSDLRGSGSIEQDADAVIFLHRTNPGDDDAARQIKMIIAKNRFGPIGSQMCEFIPATMGWREVAQVRASEPGPADRPTRAERMARPTEEDQDIF